MLFNEYVIWLLLDDDFTFLLFGSVLGAVVVAVVAAVVVVEEEMKYLAGIKVIILLKSRGNQRIHILKPISSRLVGS